jgi:hypothetical protein
VKTHKVTVEPRKKLVQASAKAWQSIAVDVLTHSPFESGRYDDLNPIEEEMRRQAVSLYQKQKSARARATHS